MMEPKTGYARITRSHKEQFMTQTLQQFIIEDQNVKNLINPSSEYRARVNVMKAALKATKRKGFVLDVDAEQGSVLSAHIAQQAITELRHETGDLRYLFLALYLPEGQPDAKEANDVAVLVRNFIKADEVIGSDIKENVQAVVRKFPELANDRGQMKTRVRTALSHSYARDRNYMVVGSGNSAENVTGHATRRGEETVSDILPLAGLSRHQVNQMLHFLNAPAFLLANVPSVNADGISYGDIDRFLGGKKVEAGVTRKIEQKFLTTEHTRREANPFFTKFDHHKFLNESRLLATL
jgi:NAD+ synthase